MKGNIAIMDEESAQPFKLYNVLDAGPKLAVTLSRNDALSMYRSMQIIRRMEQTLAKLYHAKQVRGFLHLYVGQEAVAVGINAMMRSNDSVVTGYRCHAWAQLMGLSVRSIIAEMMGKETGVCRGMAGSMHLYGKNFYGGQGIVGAQVPIGVGIALAYKYRHEDNMCVTLYGDGAANQGQVFESYNMAKLWKVPIIFVCENNLYGMGTSSQRGSANPEFFTRCEYIPGIWMDGMNVLSVREATRYAVEHFTSGKGPIIFEVFTYRYYGHSMADPGTTYRSRDEVRDVRETKDPIDFLANLMLANELTTEEELKNIHKEVKDLNDTALKEATADKEPPHEELAANVLRDPLRQTVKGVKPWDTFRYSSHTRKK